MSVETLLNGDATTVCDHALRASSPAPGISFDAAMMRSCKIKVISRRNQRNLRYIKVESMKVLLRMY